MLRLLESFFRRPVLYLLPVVVLVATGAVSTLTASKTYTSGGLIYAQTSTLVSDLSGVTNSDASAWKTPAQVTADERQHLDARHRVPDDVVRVMRAAMLDAL